jgi:hypothetical protein
MGCLRAVRRPSPRQVRLRVVPSSPWAISQLALSLPTLIEQWPELREVRIDLRLVGALDETSVASLKDMVTKASVAGIRFGVDGCSPVNTASLLALGMVV